MDKSGSMTFQVDLPIASNLTGFVDISGVLTLTGVQRGGGLVWYNESYPTKARVQVQTDSQATDFNCEMAISFRYKVIP